MKEGKETFEHKVYDREFVFSKTVKTGRRTYFFDVKTSKVNDLYLTITESKKRLNHDGSFFYEKYKIFLLKEDFESFAEGLKEVINYINLSGTAVHSEESTDEKWKKEFSEVKIEDLENK
jgi:hypothetical protein